MKLTKEQQVKLYTNMVRVRTLDEFMVIAVGERKFPIFHSQQGQEAVAVGACTFLKPDDYLFFHHRGHGIGELIAKGITMKTYLADAYGKATGTCCGISAFNVCDVDLGVLGCAGTIGEGLCTSAGAGLSAKLRGKGQVVVSMMGDGSVGMGTFHSAQLMMANWKLPVVWCLENNGISMFMPTTASYPKENIADLAFGYGIPAMIVDGQDVEAVYDAVQVAVERARAGEGPSFIEFKTCRYRSHMEGAPDNSMEKLRSEELVNNWKARDPIQLYQKKLLEEGVLTQADVDRIDREAAEEVIEADRFATESPIPEPDILEKALYAD